MEVGGAGKEGSSSQVGGGGVMRTRTIVYVQSCEKGVTSSKMECNTQALARGTREEKIKSRDGLSGEEEKC